ncbi:MAG: BrnT family toxin [Acetobacteraceae bacterium]|nr:BrnT family toxin [Acetobacteraceae bacterium]
MGDWIWDAAKNAQNLVRHRLPLAAGALVVDTDPHAVSRPDIHPDGDRWQTIGSAGGIVVLLVVHTDPADADQDGRIISVRKANPRERKAYADGYF